jgi:hypothetical protein
MGFEGVGRAAGLEAASGGLSRAGPAAPKPRSRRPLDGARACLILPPAVHSSECTRRKRSRQPTRKSTRGDRAIARRGCAMARRLERFFLFCARDPERPRDARPASQRRLRRLPRRRLRAASACWKKPREDVP